MNCSLSTLQIPHQEKHSALTMEERSPFKDHPNIPPSGPSGSTNTAHDSTKALNSKRGWYAQLTDLEITGQQKKPRLPMTVNINEPTSSLMGSMDPTPFKDATNILTNGICTHKVFLLLMTSYTLILRSNIKIVVTR